MQAARILLLFVLWPGATAGDYWKERQLIIDTEELLAIGGSISLDSKEQTANEVLLKYKEAEWQHGFENPGEYPPNLHFFDAKPLIDQSKIFKVIRALPKGALLHTHDTGMASFEYVYNITYEPNLYICTDGSDFELKFFKTPDDTLCPFGRWTSLMKARKHDSGINEMIQNALTLVVPDPHTVYADINTVWSKFQGIFIKIAPMVTYKPVFEQYYYQALQELYDDNVRYVELRTVLPDLYDLNGKIYRNRDVVKVYKEVTQQFKMANPDFIGARIIYAPPRHCSNGTMHEYAKIFKELKRRYADFVLGFDLVGQEDMGEPLTNLIQELLPLKNETQFFFHSGETNWYGSATDENLIDAILLGTKRIGHGYALLKHPELLRRVRKQGVAIEVAPISNQVLKLVADLRNHPAALFGAYDLPFVITNDDPSFWGAKGLSYDWYSAFMGIASRHDDLRYLKQLAFNSIKYSGLSPQEKERMLTTWQQDWNAFIDKLSSGLFDQ